MRREPQRRRRWLVALATEGGGVGGGRGHVDGRAACLRKWSQRGQRGAARISARSFFVSHQQVLLPVRVLHANSQICLRNKSSAFSLATQPAGRCVKRQKEGGSGAPPSCRLVDPRGPASRPRVETRGVGATMEGTGPSGQLFSVNSPPCGRSFGFGCVILVAHMYL